MTFLSDLTCGSMRCDLTQPRFGPCGCHIFQVLHSSCLQGVRLSQAKNTSPKVSFTENVSYCSIVASKAKHYMKEKGESFPVSFPVSNLYNILYSLF